MKVLYFLEPWIELGFPKFRFGTYRQHVRREIEVLIKYGWDIALITSDSIKNFIDEESIKPKGLKVFSLSDEDLTKLAPDYFSAAKIAKFDKTSNFGSGYSALIRSQMKGFEPDIIIAYESAFSAFLREAFSECCVIDSSLGLFSREPYPETFCYDPVGLFAGSSLRYCDAGFLSNHVSESKAIEFLKPIRDLYEKGFSEVEKHSVITQAREKFDTVLLLPLQVSRYFAFDFCLPEGVKFNSQIDYLVWVFDRVPSNIGICVTEHSFAPTLNHDVINELRLRYSNFIYDESNYSSTPSQKLVVKCDGVITVSSSVGFQAAFYNKYLCVLGNSHLTILADCTDINLISADGVNSPRSKNKILHFILTSYHIPFDTMISQSNWLPIFFEKIYLSFKQRGLYKFEPFGTDTEVQNIYLNSFLKIRDASSLEQRRVSFQREAKLKMLESKKREEVGSDLFEAIDNVSAVSFDLFDTLLYRVVLRPKDLLSIVAKDAANKLASWGIKTSGQEFLSLRAQQKTKVLSLLAMTGFEDCTLTQIYDGICKVLDLDETQEQVLLLSEVECEKRSLKRREKLMDVYRYALNKNKRVFILSDMYLDEKYVLDILDCHDIKGFEKLLLSSSTGTLKKTGHMYDDLVLYSKLNQADILHIGDDYHSDFLMPTAKGFKAIHIEKTSETLISNIYRAGVFTGMFEDKWSSIQKGISAKILDDTQHEFSANSLFNGSPYVLGAVAAGPILLAFSQWIVKSACEQGIRHLYFLARDGRHPKRIVEEIIRVTGVNLQCHYLLASRRLLIGATYYSEGDIFDSLDLPIHQCSLKFLLEHRFGLKFGENYSSADLLRFGLKRGVLVDRTNDFLMDKIRALLSALSDQIIERSSFERSSYEKYLNQEGFLSNEDIAVVDIGHNGTLQRKLGELTGKKFQGFYFATFSDARRLVDYGHQVSSYLLSFENQRKSEHVYCRNIGMFELIFIPSSAGVVRLHLDSSGSIHPEYMGLSEGCRVRFAGEVEQGIYDFCLEFITFLGKDIFSISLPAESSISVYKAFIEKPLKQDASLLNGIYFVDAFGGFSARYLIHPKIFKNESTHKEKVALFSESWWVVGAESISRNNSNQSIDECYSLSFRERLWLPIVRPFVKRLGKAQDVIYLEACPKLFFATLDIRYYRIIGRLLFGNAN